MKIARLAGLMLVAVLAMSLLAASVATAAPEFKPTGATISGTSGTAKLTASSGVDQIVCAKSTSTGTITSAFLAGGVVVHFLECKSSGNSGSTFCTANSKGAAEGLILTETLHGVLGSTAKTAVLDLLPVSGSKFVTLAGNSCTEETAVTGSVAGVIEPTGKSVKTGTLKFALTGGKQSISNIELSSGGTTKAKLTAFTTEATEEVAEAITYSSTTEVT